MRPPSWSSTTHSIHYFDPDPTLIGRAHPCLWNVVSAARSGSPRRDPHDQHARLSGRPRAVVHANHENLSGQNRAEFQESTGQAGTNPRHAWAYYDYPHGGPDTLEELEKRLPTNRWLPYPVTTPLILTRSLARCARCWLRSRNGGERETSASRQTRHLEDHRGPLPLRRGRQEPAHLARNRPRP